MPGPTPTPSPGTAPPAPKTSPVPSTPWTPGTPTTTTPTTSTVGGTDVFGLPISSKTGDLNEQSQFFVGGNRGVILVPGPGGSIPKTGAFNTPQYQTALDLMKQFAKMASSPNASDRQAWVNTQAELVAIGAYGSAQQPNVSWGQWTARDADALLYAMRGYQGVAGPDGAGQPVTFEEYLNQGAAMNAQFGGTTGNQGGGSSSQPPPLTVSLTDPAAIREAASTAAESALGRSFTPDELDKFVTSFQGMQTSSQTDAYNASVAGQDFTGTSPDLNAEAETYAQTEHPQEFANHQALGYVDTFLNMLLPNGSQRGGVTPEGQVG